MRSLASLAEGCPKCHTPPLYTNNRLTPVEGFKVTDEARANYRITPTVVGTAPFNALNTRRGTGFYKVPSLKGVWYRGPFGHNGEVATLEDWFDVHRLDDNYVRTGYRGYKLKSGLFPVTNMGWISQRKTRRR
jgi:cytochrome c peroxidase